MPTYDYVCDACSHAFEHFQSMSSNILRTCPECKKRKLRRLIGSGAGVIFKGGGFYETDYKRKGASSSEQKDAAAAKADSAGSAGSGDKSDSAKSSESSDAKVTKKDDSSSGKTADKSPKKAPKNASSGDAKSSA